MFFFLYKTLFLQFKIPFLSNSLASLLRKFLFTHLITRNLKNLCVVLTSSNLLNSAGDSVSYSTLVICQVMTHHHRGSSNKLGMADATNRFLQLRMK